ncbi:hypothetical protein NEIELOOT_02592 [Neisseria elongata subsp. glycolytica ATCC 29315]|uniref:Uncharacterized protein n=1 Tax=Neisseria elongata subsp. glycolytica ATCC 29315 TaxID=546263 RepID=D4DU34_NEIEG|nr:hypothetical protein NEIELOOT_02592 [Neisseria elongata subsp. glycolytica ATCC 29315]
MGFIILFPFTVGRKRRREVMGTGCRLDFYQNGCSKLCPTVLSASSAILNLRNIKPEISRITSGRLKKD